jgi:arsenate reductase-like glutaredoxin family protein
LRNELGIELDERDYSKQPLSEAELKDLFKGKDPREYINPKSPAFKAMSLKGKTLSADQTVKLMVQEPNLLKRPLTIAGRTIIAGNDRDALTKAFGS